jgi:organic radical activating enzyme
MKIVSCSSPDKMLRINWHIVNWCNYKCSYCGARGSLSYDYTDMSQFSPSSEYNLIISRLKLIDKSFEICITGGEPTLHPNLKEILIQLNGIKNLKKIHFLTNLTKPVEYFEDFKEIEKMVCYASYHPEYHNEEFFIKSKKLNFKVHISMLNSYKEKVLQTIDKCKQEKIKFSLNFLTDTPFFKSNIDNSLYREALNNDTIELDIIYENGVFEKTTEIKMLYEGKNKFKGYKCIPESYEIHMSNIIKNECTDKILSFSLRELGEKVSCPKNRCEGGLMMYPKELK